MSISEILRTSAELPVTTSTISTIEVMVHANTAEITSSLSLIHLFQIGFSIFNVFLATSFASSATATTKRTHTRSLN